MLAEDYKGWGHGLPDLLLWKEKGTCSLVSIQGFLSYGITIVTEGLAKLVEVKGPRDKLSSYQQVWLDQLIVSGLDCEVCYVRELSDSAGPQMENIQECTQASGDWSDLSQDAWPSSQTLDPSFWDSPASQ